MTISLKLDDIISGVNPRPNCIDIIDIIDITDNKDSREIKEESKENILGYASSNLVIIGKINVKFVFFN